MVDAIVMGNEKLMTNGYGMEGDRIPFTHANGEKYSIAIPPELKGLDRNNPDDKKKLEAFVDELAAAIKEDPHKAPVAPPPGVKPVKAMPCYPNLLVGAPPLPKPMADRWQAEKNRRPIEDQARYIATAIIGGNRHLLKEYPVTGDSIQLTDAKGQAFSVDFPSDLRYIDLSTKEGAAESKKFVKLLADAMEKDPKMVAKANAEFGSSAVAAVGIPGNNPKGSARGVFPQA
ncbi:MAG TPA: hypothetical protein VHB73_02485 [Alphaproteobacteria bacterium]|nr:hypothetical protein [Alphaproteobacteria bacterium]